MTVKTKAEWLELYGNLKKMGFIPIDELQVSSEKVAAIDTINATRINPVVYGSCIDIFHASVLIIDDPIQDVNLNAYIIHKGATYTFFHRDKDIIESILDIFLSAARSVVIRSDLNSYAVCYYAWFPVYEFMKKRNKKLKRRSCDE